MTQAFLKKRSTIISATPPQAGPESVPQAPTAEAVDTDGADGSPEGELRAFVVDAAGHGQRLDRVLAMQVPEFSRSYLQQLIADGAVRLDSHPATRSAHRVRAGQRGEVELRPTPQSQAFLPEPMALDVVHEDAHLLVVNKPAGLVVHPAPGHWSGTLLNGLLARDPVASTLPRAGIVHRLDKDTSGLMVAAKTEKALLDLGRQFAAHSIERVYEALVWGLPAPMEGEITGAIGRSHADRRKMTVLRAGGKAALTHYRVLRVLGGGACAHIACRLATGRTHQIRVHLTSIGHPLLGDPVYGRSAGRRRTLPETALAAIAGFDRQALDAIVLGFRHPSSGKTLRFARSLRADVAALAAALGSDAGKL